MDNNERFGQMEAMLADLLRRMDRQAEQMDRQSEQIGDIVNILKISDARQTRTEERQESMLSELKQHGCFIETMLQGQVKMLDLVSRNSGRTDELENRLPALLTYETHFQRLEDAVFNKAG